MGAGSTTSSTIYPNSPGLKRTNSLLTENNEQLQLIKESSNILNKLFNKVQRPNVQSVQIQEFQRIYIECGDNIDLFFQRVEERISDLYISLSKKTLQLMANKRLTTTESKIYISQQILYTSMNILKAIGLRTKFAFNSQNINKLNSLQLSMIGYMKAKYPRQSQNFVPGQLMEEFKNVDFVEQPENDMLKKLNIYFGDDNQKTLNLQMKRMFNLIISQIDQKFAQFQQMASEQLFLVTKQGKQYIVNNKINRKIPQNVQKFIEDDSIMDLKSPQIFKVIIKWVQDMEDYILNPDEQLRQKDHFKTVSIKNQELNFDFVTPDQIEQQFEQFQAYLTQLKQQYEKQLLELKKLIQLFNHNLIRALTKAERKQKYVPKRQAEVIKYSMFNKRFLSWMLIEKLMIVLKKLIKVSKMMEDKIGIKLDLIKFNVTDLLRASMIGNKYEIIKVFSNLKKLQSQNRVKILKIKNRLETPLNDVIIIFKMANSFLMCQLILILSYGNQAESDKLKNIEVLNYFFYELERSPYGVMSEIAALLSSKDNKINFEQKITFQKLKEMNIDVCSQKHPDCLKQYKIQKNPFICSYCTQLYGEHENQFLYKYCSNCNEFFCAKCIIESGKQYELQLRKKKVYEKLAVQLQRLFAYQSLHHGLNSSKQGAQYANSSSNEIKIKTFLNTNNSVALREIAKKNNKISFKQIQKYISQKVPGAPKQKLIYFTIAKFKGSQLQFTSMKYDGVNGIKQCFKYGYDDPIKQMSFKYFDFMLLHSDSKFSQNAMARFECNVSLFSNFSIPNMENFSKQYNAVPISLVLMESAANTIFDTRVIVDFQVNSSSNALRGYDQKKMFNYASIAAMRESLPNLLQTHQIYELGNYGIEDKHLNYFSQIQWKNHVKVVSLHNNKIKDISIVLKNLPILERLIISKNYISEIRLTSKLDNLSKLIASNNEISVFTGVENIPNIVFLNLNNNQLKTFQYKKKLQKLRVLDQGINYLQQICPLTAKQYPKLLHLTLQGDYNIVKVNPAVFFEISTLMTLSLTRLNFQKLQILNCQNLEVLKLDNISLRRIKIGEPKNLKTLTFFQCYPLQQNELVDENKIAQQKLESEIQIQNILVKNFPELVELSMYCSWGVNKLPVLTMPKVKNIYIENTQVNETTNLEHSQLDDLDQLILNGNGMHIIPILALPKLRKAQIGLNEITDASNIEKWVTPKLQQLNISRFQGAKIPSFSGLPLKQLHIQSGEFSQNFVFQNKEIQKLYLSQINCKYFPKISLPNLQTLSIVNCSQVNLQNFQHSNLSKLKQLTASYLVLQESKKKLPILNCPLLQTLYFTYCELEDAENLCKSNLPSLIQLNIQSNAITKMLPLKLPKLKKFYMYGSKLTKTDWLQTSELPQLQLLDINSNQLRQFPLLKMPKLTTINFCQCQFQSIQKLQKCDLPLLQTLNIRGSKNTFTSLVTLKFPKLKNLELDFSKLTDIKDLSKCELPNLRDLNLCNMKLTNPKLPKLKFPNLISLKMDMSNIENIDELGHSSLPKLSTLSLNKMPISELPVLKLPQLKKIQAISDENSIKLGKCLHNIDKLKNSVLPCLESIHFQGNQIKHLPQLKFEKLTEIMISDNQIVDLKQFKKSNLPNLKMINIYNNKISQFPVGKFLKPSKIYMQLGEVHSFDELPEIATFSLNFYYNEGKLPNNLPAVEWKMAQIIQFSKCQLKNIDVLVKNPMPNVKQFAVIDNQIVKAPKIIAPKLQKLYLNRNCIKDVKEFMSSYLPQIQMISLESNQIEDLVDFPFENIHEVFFNNNLFKDISFMSKYTYRKMKMLVAPNCKISKLGKINGPLLDRIYLNQNQLVTLDGLKGSILPNLTLLQLNNNILIDLSGLNAINLPSLQKIFLIGNKIKKLGKLTTVPNLMLLHLNQNPIENVDDFLTNKLNINELYLTLNLNEPNLTNTKDKISKQYSHISLSCSKFVPEQE